MKQKVVISGATSKFGRIVVKLLEKKYDLVLLSRNKSKAQALFGKNAHIVEIDLETASVKELEKILKDANCAVNIAGLVDFSASKEKLFQANAYATNILVKASENTNVKNFIHCSSIAVYRFSGNEIVDENSKTNPRNLYGQSKLAGEEFVTKSNLNWICLRPGIIYGPNFTNEVEFLIKLAKNKRLKLIGNGNNKVPLVYEEDVAYAFAQSVELLLKSKTKNQVINLVGNQKTQKECFEILLKELGIEHELKPVPLLVVINLTKLLKTIGAAKNSIDPEVLRVLALDRSFDNTKAKKLLKLNFTPIEIGIKKTLEKLMPT